jgi:hypothetical protein
MINGPRYRIERRIGAALYVLQTPFDIGEQHRAFVHEIRDFERLLARKSRTRLRLLRLVTTFLDRDELIAYDSFGFDRDHGIGADHPMHFLLNL